MNVKNCKNCKRLFNYISSEQKLCPACMQALEDKFQTVKEYILSHQGVASMAIVAEECDVDVNQIRQWVREERLEFTGYDSGGLSIECEICGAPIATGRYCNNCITRIKGGFIEAAGLNPKPVEQKAKARDKPKMRFLDLRV